METDQADDFDDVLVPIYFSDVFAALTICANQPLNVILHNTHCRSFLGCSGGV